MSTTGQEIKASVLQFEVAGAGEVVREVEDVHSRDDSELHDLDQYGLIRKEEAEHLMVVEALVMVRSEFRQSQGKSTSGAVQERVFGCKFGVETTEVDHRDPGFLAQDHEDP